jgi:hypothetical protein
MSFFTRVGRSELVRNGAAAVAIPTIRPFVEYVTTEEPFKPPVLQPLQPQPRAELGDPVTYPVEPPRLWPLAPPMVEPSYHFEPPQLPCIDCGGRVTAAPGVAVVPAAGVPVMHTTVATSATSASSNPWPLIAAVLALIIIIRG